MPATPLTVVTSSVAGATWPASDGTAADNVNGNSVPNGPNLTIVVFNGSGGAATVVFKTPYKAAGLDIAEDSKALTASERKVFGPFDKNVYGDTLEFTGSAATVKFIAQQHT